MRASVTLGIVGAGGHGIVAMGSLLQRIAASQGYFSRMPRYYTAQIRGGGSAVRLSLDARRLSLPGDVLDLLVCFSWEKYLEFESELTLGADTVVIYEDDPPSGLKLPQNSFKIGLSRISQEETGSDRNMNLVALGLLSRMLSFDRERMAPVIEEDTALQLLKENIVALDIGENIFAGLSFPDLALEPARDASPKAVIHGNNAMARAAIRAGCKAYFGYPITPAAEVMQDMLEGLFYEKGVFVQAEDEIAAAGMAIGASFVGVKSLTGTSGPGFDLMTESLGLASAAEIPLVVIDVQRCGPSTGIPSKSEQSDLDHAIYGGHGEAPRVVLAPYDIEGCYRLVIESFNIAEGFQTPVILLSDQWLGQTFVAVDSGFMENAYKLVERKRPAEQDADGYLRYRVTEDLISPMASAGDEGFTYRTTGLTHDQRGAPAFDFETHQSLHEKRWNKLAPLRGRGDLVKVFGSKKARKGIVTWGSSAPFVLETVEELGVQNRVKVCIPELIHPLPDKVVEFVQSLDRLLVVEMNYSGQLHRYLRSQLDLPGDSKAYCRAGGKPFSRGELADVIKGVAA
jgi:2-oxoglutarate ferredoxin oxidoreductase subunit alpha